MRVAITARATADLEDIFAYISVENPLAAINYVRALRARAKGLGNFPRKFAIRSDLPGDLRGVPHGSHVILYRIAKARVEVVRFVHGARDLPSVFEK